MVVTVNYHNNPMNRHGRKVSVPLFDIGDFFINKRWQLMSREEQQIDDFDQVFASGELEKITRYRDLEGKRVFITGGGSGIGAYLTAAFALQGARVSFVSLRDRAAEQLCNQVEACTGLRPHYATCDIRDLVALESSMQAAVAELGGLDVLVNNAARDTRHTIDSLTPEQWDESININLRPQFFAMQWAAREMVKAGGGSIVNLGSNSANLALCGYPAYVTAKTAIVGLTRAAARELGQKGIRVNALVPGWVMTERQKRLWVTEEALAECLAGQSLKFPIQGEDLVEGALFLASRASRVITGQQLIVDGGRV
ncbi:SDR family NAD(P)-dependent oxidoreductase [Microbulbifer bruguierae]|uniref:SDR family NAD(P)-dependent oxidoreductase n=1 Tax=Microbulbifer bruguierae TaxID=3029061 RepID=A0ABY8NGG2_9GAMM|nr:SDR family oxidoreductase [Microbulbifer bruguierae]WGL17540.1 SDR family NAD(P)-dependent oxidoreductase [Microbulbifer bruguierae]